MRVLKSLLVQLPAKLVVSRPRNMTVPSSDKRYLSQWLRITSSKWTVAFFITVLLHCVLQVSLESFALVNNLRAISTIRHITAAATGTVNGTNIGLVAWDGIDLQICHGVPSSSICQIIWSAKNASMISQSQPNVSYISIEVSVTPQELRVRSFGLVDIICSLIRPRVQPAHCRPNRRAQHL